MPEHTMPASERALADARHAVERQRGLAAGDSGRHLADFGQALLDLASLLMALPQRHEELVRVLSEAVAVVRRLDAAEGGRHRPDPAAAPSLHRADLATLLTMLALAEGTQGLRSNAAGHAREAVGIRRELVRTDPDGQVPELAAALVNLGNQLSELGDHDEALACFQEAVQLRRRFAADHPGLGESELASVLADFGIALGDAGRREEAIAALREALKRYWRLPEADSDECRVEYWAALVAIVHELTELGREADARSYLDHAEAVYHRLNRSSPEVVAFLTEALRQHGLAVGDDGLIRRAQRQAASGAERGGPHAEQSGAVDGGRAPSAPLRGALARAQAVHQEGMRRANAGDLRGALPLVREALAQIRPLAGTDPLAELVLATVMHDLGLVLAWHGRPDQALEPIGQAVHIYRKRREADPSTVGPLLAGTLDSQSSRLAALGGHRAAATAAQESVALYRSAAKADPAAQLPELGRAANNLSIRFADLDRHSEALDASQEAVAAYRQAAEASPPEPGADVSGVTHAVSNLALRLARLDHADEAAARTTEAVELIGRLPAPHPGSQLASLAVSMDWLGWYLKRHGHRPEGRAAVGAAKDLRRRLRASGRR